MPPKTKQARHDVGPIRKRLLLLQLLHGEWAAPDLPNVVGGDDGVGAKQEIDDALGYLGYSLDALVHVVPLRNAVASVCRRDVTRG